jgi:hypothetical protein
MWNRVPDYSIPFMIVEHHTIDGEPCQIGAAGRVLEQIIEIRPFSENACSQAGMSAFDRWRRR